MEEKKIQVSMKYFFYESIYSFILVGLLSHSEKIHKIQTAEFEKKKNVNLAALVTFYQNIFI